MLWGEDEAEATTCQCQGTRRAGGVSRSGSVRHPLGTGHRGHSWATAKKLHRKFPIPHTTSRPMLVSQGKNDKCSLKGVELKTTGIYSLKLLEAKS